MIWLARFAQIGSGFIIAVSAHESSVLGAVFGWMLATAVVPFLYGSSELE